MMNKSLHSCAKCNAFVLFVQNCLDKAICDFNPEKSSSFYPTPNNTQTTNLRPSLSLIQSISIRELIESIALFSLSLLLDESHPIYEEHGEFHFLLDGLDSLEVCF